MNVVSHRFTILGLDPDSGWEYAFGGKIIPMHEASITESRKNLYKKNKTTLEVAYQNPEVMNIFNRNAFLTKQVHGNSVYTLEDDLITAEKVSQIEADAIITNLPKKPIVVLTADCVPILLSDPNKKVVGAVHAGRRGTALGVLTETVDLMKKRYGIEVRFLRAAIGPSIGPCCYDVGEECAKEFTKYQNGWNRWTKRGENGKFLLDLISANRDQALNLGLHEKNIFVSGHCTACRNDLFYSWRREKTFNRNVTVAMLR
tara:strand:- start:1366 stop:2142 length:777 start_codon:yes stop_codon:yes gene_type:complete